MMWPAPSGSRPVTRRSRASRRFRSTFDDLESRRLLSTSSFINQFPVTTVASQPLRITADSNGNLWFTEYQGNNIGEMAAEPTTVSTNITVPDGETVTIPGGAIFEPGTTIQAGMMLPIGTLTEFTIPIPTAKSDPYGIVAGPDGNIYFTQSGTGEIGEITENGAGELGVISGGDNIKEYALPSSSDTMPSPNSTIASTSLSPLEITTGPGNNIFFTETGANEIGELVIESMAAPSAVPSGEFITTPGSDGQTYLAGSTDLPGILPIGTIIEFITPTANSGPTGITMGPNGSIWFTEASADNIGTLNPTTGHITEYSIPGSYGPGDIALAPDQNLWFTVNGGYNLAYINPTTGVPGFPKFTLSNFVAAGLTSANGHLWFTDDINNRIGYINVQSSPASVATFGPASGTSTTTPLNQPLGIVSADGELWFTEPAGNEIGQASISSLPSMPPVPTLTLSSTPNQLLPGEMVTFMAKVSPTDGASTPTGYVTFTVNGQQQPPVALQTAGVSGLAMLTIVITEAGAQTIMVSYGGDFFNASSKLQVTLFGDGPRVVSVERMGIHKQPTTLVVTFDQPLDVGSANNVDSYRVTTFRGRSIKITGATYDATADAVTLDLDRRLSLHRVYRLTIFGSGMDVVKDEAELALDGADTGLQGSDYVAEITGGELRRPSVSPKAVSPGKRTMRKSAHPDRSESR
jgi:streptogramin lyase